MHSRLHVDVGVVGRNDNNSILGDDHAHSRIIVARHCTFNSLSAVVEDCGGVDYVANLSLSCKNR